MKTPIIFIFAIGIISLLAYNLLAARVNFDSVDTAVQIKEWGYNSQTIDGLFIPQSEIKDTTINLDGEEIRDVAAGHDFSIVVDKSGTAYSWGNNDHGQLGRETGYWHSSEPHAISGMPPIIAVSASHFHSMFLDENGDVWVSGLNFSGQLGNGLHEPITFPQRIESLPHIKDIAAGYKFSAALAEDGTVWAWGASCSPETLENALNWWDEFANSIERISDGYYDPSGGNFKEFDPREDCIDEDHVGLQSAAPVKVESLSNIVQISAGNGHLLALSKEGNVHSFGCNKYGQRSTSEYLSALKDIVHISAGYRHSLALDKAGNVYAWGHNHFGELGSGESLERVDTPQEVAGLPSSINHIYAGRDFSAATTTNGDLWVWGKNNMGQLGLSETTDMLVPKERVGDTIGKIAMGEAHMLITSQ